MSDIRKKETDRSNGTVTEWVGVKPLKVSLTMTLSCPIDGTDDDETKQIYEKWNEFVDDYNNPKKYTTGFGVDRREVKSNTLQKEWKQPTQFMIQRFIGKMFEKRYLDV